MWLAEIICSGPDCIEQREVVIDDLDDLDQFNCDCGYGFVLLAISELAPVGR